VLRVVRPALAGMMDGSVSTLAPLFATALATRDAHTTFLVGLAAALGAGISMAFAEALSDDGSLTGRGNPWLRGLIEGLATSGGGLGHTLPFLLPDVRTALRVASAVVIAELLLISGLRFRYFKMPLFRSALQVILGHPGRCARLRQRRPDRELIRNTSVKAIGFCTPLPMSDEQSLIDLDLPEPTPRPRDLKIAVKAVSVNPVDVKTRVTSRPTPGEPRILRYHAAAGWQEVADYALAWAPEHATTTPQVATSRSTS
jgi:hypothetical protein